MISSSKVAPRASFLFLLLNGTKVCCNSGRKNAVDNEFVASFDDPCLAIPLRNFLSWHTLYRPRISNHRLSILCTPLLNMALSLKYLPSIHCSGIVLVGLFPVARKSWLRLIWNWKPVLTSPVAWIKSPISGSPCERSQCPVILEGYHWQRNGIFYVLHVHTCLKLRRSGVSYLAKNHCVPGNSH